MLLRLSAVALLSAAAASALIARESCAANEFHWPEKDCCLPEGGIPSPPACPDDKACPSEWYWHDVFGCCVPKTTPATPATPACPDTFSWVVTDQCCSKPSTTTPSCKEGEFFWEFTSCCLPHGGQPSPPPPPPGKVCPTSWSWHSDFSCCVPPEPCTPPPKCENGWPFSGIDQCCSSPWPAPSGMPKKWGWKKARGVQTFQCTAGFTACAIGEFDWECIDPMQDLTTCGGCVGPQEIGQDCTQIPNANAVGCDAGRCAVYSCKAGFHISKDGKSCIPKKHVHSGQGAMGLPQVDSHNIH